MPRGLYHKYDVFYADEVTPLEGEFFVLRPDRDPHAHEAIWAYARSVRPKNPVLADDLERWLKKLNREAIEAQKAEDRARKAAGV